MVCMCVRVSPFSANIRKCQTTSRFSGHTDDVDDDDDEYDDADVDDDDADADGE